MNSLSFLESLTLSGNILITEKPVIFEPSKTKMSFIMALDRSVENIMPVTVGSFSRAGSFFDSSFWAREGDVLGTFIRPRKKDMLIMVVITQKAVMRALRIYTERFHPVLNFFSPKVFFKETFSGNKDFKVSCFLISVFLIFCVFLRAVPIILMCLPLNG